MWLHFAPRLRDLSTGILSALIEGSFEIEERTVAVEEMVVIPAAAVSVPFFLWPLELFDCFLLVRYRYV